MPERLGNHQSVQCSEAIKAEAYEVMKLTNELYRAVSEREFVLYYQPQVDVTTETIIGVEALIRWNHPDKGLIPPGKFIPIAESTGLIVDIGLWAMQEACMQAKKWQNKKLRSLNIAVNVSLGQLLNPSFVDDVGTEYSSLSRLKAMPVDKIKIDMRFVQGIAVSDKDEGIIKTIIQMAKYFKVKVIAEEVEKMLQKEKKDRRLENAQKE